MKTQLVGDIPAGLPTFSTSTIYFSYFSSLFPTALAIAIIAFLESIAISKNLASLNDYKVGGGGVV
jgi:SulP family sulfate permease